MTRRTIQLPSGERVPLATLRRLVVEQRQPVIEQPALFAMIDDARPAGTRTAAERYREPSLFALLEE